MTIHPEAVDALARWECNQDGLDFATVDPDIEDRYLFHARKRLEAVELFVSGYALQELASEIRAIGGSHYAPGEIAEILHGRGESDLKLARAKRS